MPGSVFDPQDLDILQHAVRMVPDLARASLVAKAVRERLVFPVVEVTDLQRLLEEYGQLDDRREWSSDAPVFGLDDWLPIEDEFDLVGKVVAASRWRQMRRWAELAGAEASNFRSMGNSSTALCAALFPYG